MKKLPGLIIPFLLLFVVNAKYVNGYIGQCCDTNADCDQTSGAETCTGPPNNWCIIQVSGSLTCELPGSGCLTDSTSCDPFATIDPCCNPCQIARNGNYYCGAVMPPQDPDELEPFRPTDCTGPYDVYGPSLMSGIGCISTYPIAFITQIQGILITLGGGIAFLLMIIGSFFLLTSKGDPEVLQRGRQIFTGALIGLLLMIFSVYLFELIGVDILNLFR